MLPTNGILYVCSPRAGGNSDCAAECVKKGAFLAEKTLSILHIRDYVVHGCTGCHACASFPFHCKLDEKDIPPSSMEILIQPLLEAPLLLFVAPVFFYHFPAQFKAFMDRTQKFYLMRQAGVLPLQTLPARKAYPILLGARQRGNSLFSGCLHSLQIMLDLFNIALAEPLLLRGFDRKNALSLDCMAQNMIIKYTADAFSSQ